MISAATVETMPALPASMSIMMIRRRTGWLISCSDSLVVYPVPVKAERAWKRARFNPTPVSTNATVATRTTSRLKKMTTSTVRIAAMRPQHPATAGGHQCESLISVAAFRHVSPLAAGPVRPLSVVRCPL